MTKIFKFLAVITTFDSTYTKESTILAVYTTIMQDSNANAQNINFTEQ